VLAINDTPVKSVGALRAPAGKSARTVALLVQRGDARTFVAVEARARGRVFRERECPAPWLPLPQQRRDRHLTAPRNRRHP